MCNMIVDFVLFAKSTESVLPLITFQINLPLLLVVLSVRTLQAAEVKHERGNIKKIYEP